MNNGQCSAGGKSFSRTLKLAGSRRTWVTAARLILSGVEGCAGAGERWCGGHAGSTAQQQDSGREVAERKKSTPATTTGTTLAGRRVYYYRAGHGPPAAHPRALDQDGRPHAADGYVFKASLPVAA